LRRPLTLPPMEWQHPETGCDYRDEPYVADRRTGAQIALGVDDPTPSSGHCSGGTSR